MFSLIHKCSEENLLIRDLGGGGCHLQETRMRIQISDVARVLSDHTATHCVLVDEGFGTTVGRGKDGQEEGKERGGERGKGVCVVMDCYIQ
jgi:hypothetical protein